VETTSIRRTPILYGISVWMIINIALMALLILGGDWEDLNNWIEIALWATAIPALLSTKKWGIAYVIIVLAYTLSTSVGIIMYYQIWLNAFRFINIPIIIYLFHRIFNN
jgi:hypothetical protein